MPHALYDGVCLDIAEEKIRPGSGHIHDEDKFWRGSHLEERVWTVEGKLAREGLEQRKIKLGGKEGSNAVLYTRRSGPSVSVPITSCCVLRS